MPDPSDCVSGVTSPQSPVQERQEQSSAAKRVARFRKLWPRLKPRLECIVPDVAAALAPSPPRVRGPIDDELFDDSGSLSERPPSVQRSVAHLLEDMQRDEDQLRRSRAPIPDQRRSPAMSVPTPKSRGSFPTSHHVDADEFESHPALRVNLVRRRFGNGRKWFCEFPQPPSSRGIPRSWPLLTVQLEPPASASAEEWEMFRALKIANVDDDKGGVFKPGCHVQRDRIIALGVPDVLRRVLLHGFDPPLVTDIQRRHMALYKSCAETYLDVAAAEFDRNIELGKLEGPLDHVPWVVNPQGCVERFKDSGDIRHRLTTDATRSGLNPASIPPPCEYDDISKVIPILSKGAWMSVIDWKDAFPHWPMSQSFSNLFGVQHPRTGAYYRYRYCAFGFNASPWLQASIVAWLKRHIRDELGITTAVFVDDWILINADSKEACDADTERLLQFFEDKGIKAPRAKVSWASQNQLFLGFLIDTANQVLSVGEVKARRYVAAIQEQLRALPPAEADGRFVVNRRDLASVVGKLLFISPAVRGGPSHLQYLFDACSDMADGASVDEWGPDTSVFLSQAAVDELHWWESFPSNAGVPLHLDDPICPGIWRGQAPDDDAALDESSRTESGIPVFTTDAAGEIGLGGWFESDEFARQWELHEEEWHINRKELLAIKEGLLRWGHLWTGQRVLVRTDNTVAAACVNRGRSRSPELHPLAVEINDLARSQGIMLAARHIPGERNSRADGLSRFLLVEPSPKWALAESTWNSLPSMPSFSMDAFATASSSRAPTAFDKVSEFEAASVEGHTVWAFPRFSQVRSVLQRLLQARRLQPCTTAARVIVPQRFWESWWGLTKSFRKFATLPVSTTRLVDVRSPSTAEFPSPEPLLLIGFDATLGQPGEGPPPARRDRRPPTDAEIAVAGRLSMPPMPERCAVVRCTGVPVKQCVGCHRAKCASCLRIRADRLLCELYVCPSCKIRPEASVDISLLAAPGAAEVLQAGAAFQQEVTDAELALRTCATYLSHIRSFRRWFAGTWPGRSPLPIPATTVGAAVIVAYAGSLVGRVEPDTIAHHVSALSKWHVIAARAHPLRNPCDAEPVLQFLADLKNKYGVPAQPKHGVSLEMIQAVASFQPANRLDAHRRLLAIFLFIFLLRRVAAAGIILIRHADGSFHKDSDVKVLSDEQNRRFLWVRVRHDKGLRNFECNYRVFPEDSTLGFNPVAIFEHYLEVHNPPNGFLFSTPIGTSKWSSNPFSSWSHFADWFARITRCDRSIFTPHSFRRGFAMLLWRLGVPKGVIRQMGKWKSDTIFQYLASSPQHMLRVCRSLRVGLLRQ